MTIEAALSVTLNLFQGRINTDLCLLDYGLWMLLLVYHQGIILIIVNIKAYLSSKKVKQSEP
jgi:hypothetical protein